MKIRVELSEEEHHQLEVLGISVEEFLKPHLNNFFSSTEAYLRHRTYTAITGAMRWEWSQECSIHISWRMT